MSVSFNNRPHVNVDQFSLDNKPVASAKSPGNSNVQSSGTPISQAGLRNEKPPVLNNQVMVPGAAFTKLFDMLEQIFSAMREMFMGPKTTPDILHDSNKTLVKTNAHQHPDKQNMKTFEVKLQPSTPGAVTSEVPVQNLSVGMPRGPQPSIVVTNDAKSDVHLNVSVGHCHCPESADSDAKSKMRPDNRIAIKPGKDVDGKVKVEVETKRGTNAEGNVQAQAKTDTTPGTNADGKVKVEVETKRGTNAEGNAQAQAKTDTTPGTNADGKVKVEVETKRGTNAEGNAQAQAKTGTTPGTNAGGKVKVEVETRQGTNAEGSAQAKAGITPDATPTSTVVPDITSKLLPEEPGEVLTSPGPDEIQFNARNWQLNVRNAYKS